MNNEYIFETIFSELKVLGLVFFNHDLHLKFLGFQIIQGVHTYISFR